MLCRRLWCGEVWSGVVWCGVVWSGVMWSGVVWSGVVLCGMVGCGVGCWNPTCPRFITCNGPGRRCGGRSGKLRGGGGNSASNFRWWILVRFTGIYCRLRFVGFKPFYMFRCYNGVVMGQNGPGP